VADLIESIGCAVNLRFSFNVLFQASGVRELKKVNLFIGAVAVSFSLQVFASDCAAPSETNYITASKTVSLKPGEKVRNLFDAHAGEEFVLQKISGDLYVMFSQFYNVPFYVGKQGVLVFDPAAGSGEALLKAIKSVTQLPVTTLVYSHHHQDHLDGSAAVVTAMKARGVDVDVLATRKTREILDYMGQEGYAPITRTLDVQQGASDFTFEDLKIDVVGFDYPNHSLDQSVFLIDKYKVLLAPDMVSPDQLPFFRLSYGSGNSASYIDNLEAINRLPWNIVVGGHGNVGTKKDIDFLIEFLTDIESSVARAIEQAPTVDPKQYGTDSAAPYLQEAFIIRQVRSELDKKYGGYVDYQYVVDSFVQEAIVYLATGVRKKR
jgi:glyoxylase-like metal-dependent hydrolase (beta-lactamase superfamily II)